MITLKNIYKTYQNKNRAEVLALKDFSLSAQAKDFVVVKGESGAGKSTLLFIISGMLSPESGQVLVCDREVTNLTEKQKSKLRKELIGYVFQSFQLVPYLNVKENIELAFPEKDLNNSKLAELCQQLNITNKMECYISELSAGEKQRVALARALVKNPAIILADEPTGNLDKENSKIIVNTLKNYANNGGIVIMVTHSDSADSYATKQVIVEKQF